MVKNFVKARLALSLVFTLCVSSVCAESAMVADVNITKTKKTQAMLDAIQSNDEAKLQQLITDGADVNYQSITRDETGRVISCSDRPLPMAVRRRLLRMVDLLIAAGADVNAECYQEGKGYNESSPKDWEVIIYNNTIFDEIGYGPYSSDRKLIIKSLLRAGAQPSVNALWKILADCDSVFLGELLAAGLDIGIVNQPINEYGYTLIQIAAEDDKEKMVNFLLCDCKADIHTHYGTALTLAAYFGDDATARKLIHQEIGADVRSDAVLVDLIEDTSFTPRITQMIRVLLDAGANPNARNEDGFTVLQLSRAAVVSKMLLAAGADINACDNIYGSTALIGTIQFNYEQSSGDDEIARLLIDAGADITVKDAKGLTALDHAQAKLKSSSMPKDQAIYSSIIAMLKAKEAKLKAEKAESIAKQQLSLIK